MSASLSVVDHYRVHCRCRCRGPAGMRDNYTFVQVGWVTWIRYYRRSLSTKNNSNNEISCLMSISAGLFCVPRFPLRVQRVRHVIDKAFVKKWLAENSYYFIFISYWSCTFMILKFELPNLSLKMYLICLLRECSLGFKAPSVRQSTGILQWPTEWKEW